MTCFPKAVAEWKWLGMKKPEQVILTSSNFALYTSHCCAMLLVPFASNFWAYSATFSSISRSFFRLLSSISATLGVSTEAVGGSSGLFGESSLADGLRNERKRVCLTSFRHHQKKNERRAEGLRMLSRYFNAQIREKHSGEVVVSVVDFGSESWFQASPQPSCFFF